MWGRLENFEVKKTDKSKSEYKNICARFMQTKPLRWGPLTKNFQAHHGVNKNADEGHEAWLKALELYKGHYIASHRGTNIPSITAYY